MQKTITLQNHVLIVVYWSTLVVGMFASYMARAAETHDELYAMAEDVEGDFLETFFLRNLFDESVHESEIQESEIQSEEEVKCLALNIYFEARSEPNQGKLGVGHVVMNRVANSYYPNTVCEVVQQGGEDRLNRCQFSWWCDGRSDKPLNRKAWEDSMQIARAIYAGKSEDPTKGALWYHADYVKPYWKDSFSVAVKIGQHIFYRKKALPKYSMK